ncbi:MAG: hypothetical protein AVDCRST_MAG17-2160 [uncultured Solirubrobacterales bacterium]|uniref:Uncharacterized protein n=1 Tax=uncultured Solirubrobacterales bacterium TaxID=768556 RepID=A0A6J4T4P0_9ACTN|nr:MAG: hypothetical protein AVDCRST_MAG17-2160 [uncultured Solirubrobacterales bacterium]
MTEEQAVDEQSKDASAEQEESTFGRMKSRVKDLVGSGSDDEQRDSEAQDSGEEASEQDGSSTEAEGSDEESASDEEEGSDEEGTSVGTDEVELSTVAEDEDTARAQIDKMEEDGPPEDLGDWPTGKAMYLSFGGAEGEQGYEEGPARQMGPSSLRHHADGSVEVQGEMVDNPDDYKGEKSVGEEADEIGMDKGAKSEGDEGDDESSNEDGSASEEGSSSDEDPQAESSDNAGAADGGDSQSDGSSSDQPESQQTEGQPAETS